MSAIICTFSGGLEDLSRKHQADPLSVLRVLVKAGRYSAFEASANPTIARTMHRLHHKALIYGGKGYGGPLLKADHTLGYPWIKVVLGEAGVALMADYPEEAKSDQCKT